MLAETLALVFLFRYNKFHESAFLRLTSESTGWFNARYDKVDAYFHLREANKRLAQQNEILLNQLRMNFQNLDTSSHQVKDTLFVDSVRLPRQYLWRGAKVVGNTAGLQNNYITLQRGEKQGVRKDMGVISTGGIVGTVVSTSENYAVVMSLLHRQFRVSAKIKKSGDLGIVQWDGKSPLYVVMTNVPKSVSIAKGDTVVTSQYSYLFPQGLMVGTVTEIVNDPSSNFYTMRLKSGTDFYKLEYVYVVENLQREEQQKIEETTKGSNE